MKDRAPVIKQLLSELNQTLKMSVGKAIQIGQLLSEQKEEMEHGKFLPWIENNFDMSERNAQRYMKLFQYGDKTAKLSDLQTAYQQIETIEKQEKQKQEQEDNKKIFQYKKTGVKPEGWERKHDYQYKKMLDDVEYEKRKKTAFDEQKQKDSNRTKEIDNNLKKSRESAERLIDSLGHAIEQEKRKSDKVKQLRISRNDEIIDQEIYFETFRDYLEQFDNINRRLEIIQNFIKYAKGLAIEYNRTIAANQ